MNNSVRGPPSPPLKTNQLKTFGEFAYSQLLAVKSYAQGIFVADLAVLEDVLITPPLLIRYLPGTSRTLVVSFSGVGNWGDTEPAHEFFNAAWDKGNNHVLFISDTNRSWMNTPGMAEAIFDSIKDTVNRINADHVAAIGNSMGATMALIMSELYNFNSVIAFVPQYSVDSNLVPEERRWKFYRKQIKHYSYPSVGLLSESDTMFFIIHGGSDREWIHAQHFPEGPMIAHFIFPDEDHHIAKRIKASNRLRKIIRFGINGRRWRFRQEIEGLGGILRPKFEQQRTKAKPIENPT